jgi:uncharacterized protein YutE (UPF0331/DUF86 family)
VIDIDLLTRKLAHIEALVQEIWDLGHPSEIQEDLRERRFLERSLQLAVQCVLDVSARLLVAAEGKDSERAPMDFLEQNGWVPEELATRMRGWVRFRNSLVYDEEFNDVELLERLVTGRLGDLLAFVQAIRQQLRPS